MLCGIDEAGRGPIAGPLVVVGAKLPKPVQGLADSKKLSEKKREFLYEKLIQTALYHVVVIQAETLDEEGLSLCMKYALQEIVDTFKGDTFLFDGNTSFGVENMPTLVKADDKIEEVKAASIIAKVTRDKMMLAYDKHYTAYGFKGHKGYGTKAHIEAIKKYGYCEIHRKSFKVKALQGFI